jgi:hypothetical protein
MYPIPHRWLLHPTVLLLHAVISPPGPATLVLHRAGRLLLYSAAIHNRAPHPRQFGPYRYEHQAGCVFVAHCVYCWDIALLPVLLTVFEEGDLIRFGCGSAKKLFINYFL